VARVGKGRACACTGRWAYCVALPLLFANSGAVKAAPLAICGGWIIEEIAVWRRQGDMASYPLARRPAITVHSGCRGAASGNGPPRPHHRPQTPPSCPTMPPPYFRRRRRWAITRWGNSAMPPPLSPSVATPSWTVRFLDRFSGSPDFFPHGPELVLCYLFMGERLRRPGSPAPSVPQ